jgi:hypothetical protein
MSKILPELIQTTITLDEDGVLAIQQPEDVLSGEDERTIYIHRAYILMFLTAISEVLKSETTEA